MNYEFHPEAESEFFEAINYLEESDVGLGKSFAQQIFATIQKITRFPFAWTPISKNARRILVNKFSYGIIYQVIDDEILVVAVMHLSRKPNYWSGRAK